MNLSEAYAYYEIDKKLLRLNSSIIKIIIFKKQFYI